MEGLPADAAIRRDDGYTRAEELAAIAVERADAWGKALWDLAVRPHLKSPPKEISHPGVIEIPRPGEPVKQAEPEEKAEHDAAQLSRRRAALFT